MAVGDLDVKLLHAIMVKLGDLRDRSPIDPPSEGDLMKLERDRGLTSMEALNHLQRHTDYLKEKGLLTMHAPAGIYRVLRLTVKGQSCVQPELSEFGEAPMLPAIVKNVEDQISILTYPEPEKARLVRALREAVADKAPEVIAQIIVEVGKKMAGI